MSSRFTREADAAPCEVITATFVFVSVRCGKPAWFTVRTRFDGSERRICQQHRDDPFIGYAQ